ncbi:MAG: TOBE domain-containing protein [Chloroflexia bacterium]
MRSVVTGTSYLKSGRCAVQFIGYIINRLRGRIEEITFLGSIVRIRLRLREVALHFDMFNNPHLSLPRIGETVTITFPREAVLPMGSTAARSG